MNYFQYLYELFWGNYKKTKLLMPDKKLVRAEVNKRPFEPFGVPGMTTTVKQDDNIAKLVQEYDRKIRGYDDSDF